MTDAAAPDQRLLDLEIEKHRLECEKLRAEIEEVRQPLWKRSGWIASLSPMVIALVAFLSAWVTGYFDDRRSVLESQVASLTTEIGALDARRADLEQATSRLQAQNDELAATGKALAIANAEMRQSIDAAYLRLKAVTGEARYALGHHRAFEINSQIEELIRTVEARADDESTAEIITRLRTLLGEKLSLTEIIRTTEEELGTLDQALATLPSSEWMRTLRYEPSPDGTLLVADDGRVFDVDRGLFFDTIEDLRAGRPSANQPGHLP